MTIRIVRADDIIWRRIEDEVVLIKDDGLAVHVLNKTAAIIWEMCDGENAIEKIAATLCERFDISPDEAISDVKDTINKLENVGLLKLVEGVTGQ